MFLQESPAFTATRSPTATPTILYSAKKAKNSSIIAIRW